jgi:hypothetical protein
MAGWPMHIDSDLLSYGYTTGNRDQDPELGASVLRIGSSSSNCGIRRFDSSSGFCESSDEEERELWGSSSDSRLRESRKHYKNGLFSRVVRMCSDAGNGLVWCAGDGGWRIKAFR